MELKNYLHLLVMSHLFFCRSTSPVRIDTIDLSQAVREKSAFKVKLFLDYVKDKPDLLRAALQKRDPQYQCTPLHMAVIKGDKDSVKILLAAQGIESVINVQDWLGCTPLFCALHITDELESAAMVELLINAGADTTIKGRYNRNGCDPITPHKYAVRRKYNHVASYIALFNK